MKKRFKSASVTVFVDEVEVVGGFEGFDESDDILVFQGAEDIDLIDGKLFEFRIWLERVFGDYFDCVLFFWLLMDSSEDLSVNTFSYWLLQ